MTTQLKTLVSSKVLF